MFLNALKQYLPLHKIICIDVLLLAGIRVSNFETAVLSAALSARFSL